jgi:hypothetical protein
MYEDWLHYVCMVSENTCPLKNIAHLLFLDTCTAADCERTDMSGTEKIIVLSIGLNKLFEVL